jgi:hypothetical protein
MDTERDFHPVVSSFHQTYKADKIRILYLSTGRTLFTTKNLEVISLARERGHHLTTVTKCYTWIKLSWGPLKTFYCQEIEK